MKKKYALISVYNKIGLNKICKIFLKYNINIISTGSTAVQIKKMGFDCKLVSDLTKFKEILELNRLPGTLGKNGPTYHCGLTVRLRIVLTSAETLVRRV